MMMIIYAIDGKQDKTKLNQNSIKFDIDDDLINSACLFLNHGQMMILFNHNRYRDRYQ